VELVGRRSERDILERALDRTVDGHRTVVLVRGDPGIGKTALVSDFRNLASGRGATVLGSSVTEAESGIGWSGLATLLRGLDPELLRSASGSRVDVLDAIVRPATDEEVDPLSVASALSDVLRSLAVSQPLVVVLDDLHWFDHATAGALSFAMRLLVDHPILIVATARPVSLPIDIARIVDPDDLVVIEPTALSLAATRELLASRFFVQLGHIDLVRLHELSAGNPLHVAETGRLLHAGVAIEDALRPASLRALIDTNLARLDIADEEVLAACALMPGAQLQLLYQLFGVERVDDALTAGEQLDLVHVDECDGDAIVFRHPLLRSGLGERLPLVARRRLHRRCAELDVPIEARALHLGASIVGSDPDAADVIDAAVDATRRSGLLTEALMHAERALALTDPADHVATRRRTLQAADLAVSAGEPARGLELVDPLIAAFDIERREPADAPDLLIVAGRAHSALYGASTALPWLERAAALLPEGSPKRARQLGRIVSTMLYVDVDQARERCLEFVTAAATGGDRMLEQIAHATYCVTQVLGGLPLVTPPEPVHAALDIDVVIDWLQVAVWTDEHARAEQLMVEASRWLAERPSVTNEHNLAMQASDLRSRQGRLEEAAVLAERAWALADAVDGGSGRSSELAVIAAVRGDTDTAHRHAVMLASMPPDASAAIAGQVEFAIAMVAALDGDHRLAVNRFRATLTLFDGCGIRDLGALPVRPELMDALIHAGELDDAERLATEIVELAARAGRPRGAAEALRAMAQIAAGRRRLDEAAELARSAADAFEQIGLPVERARTLVLAASIARRARRRIEARAFLEQAHGELVRCGALGYLPRVRAEMERLGDRADADALTNTERKIADLVAEGMTNAEVAAQLYVSARTVEAHLTQIYRKEGVRNRSELAARRRT